MFATSYKILQNLASPRKPRRPARERVPAEDARELEARGPRDGGGRREHLKHREAGREAALSTQEFSRSRSTE